MLISGACEQTGTGFIKMDKAKGAPFKLSEDPNAEERHASCRGNPATNEWIPSADTVRLGEHSPVYPMQVQGRLQSASLLTNASLSKLLLLPFRCTRRQTSQAEATTEGLYISSHENSDECFPPLE